MLCCIGEIASFVFGILALVRGQFTLTRNRVVQGGSARAIGVLLLFPLILGQGGEVVYAAIWFAQHGMNANQGGFNIGNVPDELRTAALIINLVGAGVPLLAALIIALATAKPLPRKRDLYREDEEDDYGDRDRPRRRPDDEPLD